ncbi:MAG: hypothetical protein NTY98_06710, partial [Verrucomicrobia bacterium]|nr:hypothetical protein [Verrucomicrobiota bacterium]
MIDLKWHNNMKAKMNWIVIVFVSAMLATATIAKDTALWDGTCRNVTHQLEPVINFKKCCTPVRVQAISLGWNLRPPSQELPTPVMSAMQNGTFAV